MLTFLKFTVCKITICFEILFAYIIDAGDIRLNNPIVLIRLDISTNKKSIVFPLIELISQFGRPSGGMGRKYSNTPSAINDHPRALRCIDEHFQNYDFYLIS